MEFTLKELRVLGALNWAPVTMLEDPGRMNAPGIESFDQDGLVVDVIVTPDDQLVVSVGGMTDRSVVLERVGSGDEVKTVAEGKTDTDGFAELGSARGYAQEAEEGDSFKIRIS